MYKKVLLKSLFITKKLLFFVRIIVFKGMIFYNVESISSLNLFFIQYLLFVFKENIDRKSKYYSITIPILQGFTK